MHAGKGCSDEHATKVAHARLQKKKAEAQKMKAAHPVLSQIVEADEGVKDENNYARLSKLML